MSPSQSRIPPERLDRSPSPTKGLGGFVQSAMLKRSDSINKRWSVQASQGLSRGNSIASRVTKVPSQTPSGDLTTSGTSSSFGQMVQEEGQHISLPSSGLNTLSNITPDASIAVESTRGRPSSPSKTLEPRRWSPTKPTWLDRAIQKSDAPPLKPAVSQQPAWMVGLTKAKHSRGSVDSDRVLEVSSMGFGSRKAHITSSSLTWLQKQDSISPLLEHEASERMPNPTDHAKAPRVSQQPSPDRALPPARQRGPVISEMAPVPLIAKRNPPVLARASISSKASTTTKVGPELSPKTDFRSTLKSRQNFGGNDKKDEAEFKNVFGKLKPAETKNYVAPDELKSNILRGKFGLAVTGGPKKTERVDEFKDSILKKKEQMKGGILPYAISRKISAEASRESDIPEAIAKRRGMASRAETVVHTEQPAITSGPREETFAGRTKPAPVRKIGGVGKLRAEPSSGGLADRFNPALAGLLARGPSIPVGNNASIRPTSSASISDRISNELGFPTKGQPLTHMTKERARGPKRRTPKSIAHAEIAIDSTVSAAGPEMITPELKNIFPARANPDITESQGRDQENRTGQGTASIEGQGMTSLAYRSKSEKPLPLKKLSPTSPTQKQAVPTSIQASFGSERDIMDSKLHPSPPVPSNKPDSLIKACLPSPRTHVTTGISSRSPPNETFQLKDPPNDPPKDPKDFPKQPSKTLPKDLHCRELLEQHFGNEASPAKIEIDTQSAFKSLGSNNAGGSQIKTFRKQVWILSSDGKREPVPSQREHILYDDTMYLCSHVFGSPSDGKRITEVYHWSGDGVSPSAIEDAQLFARNAAKEAGGRLIPLSQGKESSNFLEALGGIVITRRGSGSSGGSSALATYMLCGRRHMGQIAFDEVDFRKENLCSGFPFIIAATAGRLFLWIGQGSAADEVGCARLIGMDLSLLGEVEEVEEGKEASSFWQAFPSGDTSSRLISGHWHSKGGNDRYATRLFSIDVDPRPKSAGFWARRGSAPAIEKAEIKEITPYSQADLVREGVYMVDAFFEIFMYVSSSARSVLPAFGVQR